ncbi:MAG: hypothetical protein EXR48_01370 [Dehalococcoidia bacterium]|nr:hypothetical protein [Dehalococcoidia bacterium]
MLNRQIALLFLLGVAIAVAGVAAAVAAPLPTRITNSSGSLDTSLRVLLALAALLIAGSQALVLRSALRVTAGGPKGMVPARTNRGLELVWALLPGAMVLAAAVYAVADH